MSKKSEVFILDVLMKNEAKHTDMIDIMTVMHNYLGDGYADGRVVVSGGDHLTCERQIGSQRHLMCGNTRRDRLELLEPVVENWHALVCLLNVSKVHVNFNYCYHTCTCRLCGTICIGHHLVTMEHFPSSETS